MTLNKDKWWLTRHEIRKRRRTKRVLGIAFIVMGIAHLIFGVWFAGVLSVIVGTLFYHLKVEFL